MRKLADLIREATFPDEDRHWIVQCFAGAMMAAIGWFTVENIWQFHKSGELFEPRGWSFTSLIVWVLVGVVVGALGGRLERSWRRRHAEGIRAVAAQLGFAYSANAEILRAIGSQLPMLHGWHQSEHLISGERDGVSVNMFDLSALRYDGDGPGRSIQTVIMLRAEGLPDVDIAPRSFLMLGKWSGLRFAATDSRSSTTEAAVAEFTRRFAVYCGYNRDESSIASLHCTLEEEEAVRTLLTPSVMQSLLSHEGWWIESRNGWLALSLGRGFRPPSERPAMIEQSITMWSILMGNRQ